jgi:hypothetical protein
MDRVHELREFISAFFSMVKSFEPLTAAVQKTAPEHTPSVNSTRTLQLFGSSAVSQ